MVGRAMSSSAAGAAIAALVLASGNGPWAKEAPTENPYAARYLEARQLATSDFERDALAGWPISGAEYEEAVSRYVACMDQAGFPVTLDDQHGYYSYAVASAPGVDAANDGCAEGTTMLVAGIYVDELINPRAEDVDTLVVSCLQRAGLVSVAYSPERLGRDLTDAALPFDDTEPVFDACMAHPTRDGGPS